MLFSLQDNWLIVIVQLKTYMQQRVLMIQEGLVAFTESQIRTSRETYSQLVQSLKDAQTEL